MRFPLTASACSAELCWSPITINVGVLLLLYRKIHPRSFHLKTGNPPFYVSLVIRFRDKYHLILPHVFQVSVLFKFPPQTPVSSWFFCGSAPATSFRLSAESGSTTSSDFVAGLFEGVSGAVAFSGFDGSFDSFGVIWFFSSDTVLKSKGYKNYGSKPAEIESLMNK